ncbi:MAG: AraC family transcriptional regulator ligand-binding domain-containing protein [Archangium sp.]|nr:AraC family transcriptional regulator ligand-binding domain-containing protein [Archangium sp.]
MRRFSSACVPLFVRVLRARGVRVRSLLMTHGLPEGVEREEEAALPFDALDAFANDCARLAGDEHFGLHVGASLGRGTFGLVEFAVRTTPTLRGAIDQLGRYKALLNGWATIELEEGRTLARLIHRVDGHRGAFGRHANELTLAVLHRRMRELTGGAVTVNRVHFAHGPPRDVAPLVQFFGTRALIFDAGENALTFPRAQLELRNVEADEALARVLDRQAELQAAQRPAVNDVVAQVRASIRAALRTQLPTVRGVAKTLGLSTRDLQRRLAAAETTFLLELDAVRASLAALHLEQPNGSLAEVAYALRYSDVRSLTRAQKRWARAKA